MVPRKRILGCAAFCVILLAVGAVLGVFAARRLTATVPFPDVADLMGEGTHGFAVLTLHADDPWIASLIERVDEKRRDRADLLPVELAWVSFRAPDGSAGQAIRLAVSRRGRLIASLLDLALWHAGHSGDANVSRIEHTGEGITSFPGSPVPGFLFVRDTSIVWAPSAGAASRTVEVLEQPAENSARSLLEHSPAAPRAILRGAIRNSGGSMAATLRSIPGSALEIEDRLTASIDLVSFRFETTSPDEGTGIVTVDFSPGTPGARARRVSERLAERIAALGNEDLAFRTGVDVDGERAVIEVDASGLRSLHERILSAPDRLREAFRQFEIEQADDGDA